MSNVFADTSGWGNLIDISQPFHSLTATIYRLARQQNQKLITTNYIMSELVALLTSPLRLSRNKTVAFIQSLKASPYIEIIHIAPDLDAEAWQLLSTRLDKEWSLVDCSSFVIMQHLNLTEALTTDHHFEQAGFVRLLKCFFNFARSASADIFLTTDDRLLRKAKQYPEIIDILAENPVIWLMNILQEGN